MFLLFLQHLLFYFFLFSFVTFILQGMDENKAQALTFPRVSITRPLNFNTARNAATGLVSMSTRPDPDGSDTVVIGGTSRANTATANLYVILL